MGRIRKEKERKSGYQYEGIRAALHSSVGREGRPPRRYSCLQFEYVPKPIFDVPLPENGNLLKKPELIDRV